MGYKAPSDSEDEQEPEQADEETPLPLASNVPAPPKAGDGKATGQSFIKRFLESFSKIFPNSPFRGFFK